MVGYGAYNNIRRPLLFGIIFIGCYEVFVCQYVCMGVPQDMVLGPLLIYYRHMVVPPEHDVVTTIGVLQEYRCTPGHGHGTSMGVLQGMVL